jgi:hypothetical protein
VNSNCEVITFCLVPRVRVRSLDANLGLASRRANPQYQARDLKNLSKESG